MIIELEIKGARVTISGDNLTVNVTEETAPKRISKVAPSDLPTPQQIVSLRQSLGLSQKEFGAMVKASQPTVGRWESNTAEPRGEPAVKLSELFKREFEQLVTPTPSIHGELQ